MSPFLTPVLSLRSLGIKLLPLGGVAVKICASICIAAALLIGCVQSVVCDTLRVNIEFSPAATLNAAVRTSSKKRQAIDRICIKGFSSSISSGNPALPCKYIYVALPPDADENSVAVCLKSITTSELPGSYEIAPTAAIACSEKPDWGQNKKIASGRNLLVYKKNRFYPSQHLRIAAVGRLRSWKIATLEFWPYSYNPKTGKLRIVNAGQATLNFKRKANAYIEPSDSVASEMAGFVENQADARTWYAAANAANFGYVIITTSAIASASKALSDFVSYKSARGFSVKIATESDWGGGTGNTAAENIRSWLKLNYQKLSIQYALLIGGADPSTGTVPMKLLWPRRWASSYRDAPSDYYYSDLSGNWDLDGDGYAGEEPDDFGDGGIDRIPDVYVGRIPYYGSISELDSILRKTINYESVSPGPWAKTFILPMVALDTDTLSYQLGEQISNTFVRPLGLIPDRIYEASYNLSIAPEHCPCAYNTVQNDWTNGAGLVFWMTHGSQNTASNVFASSRCAYLDDSRPAIAFMGSCLNGKPEVSDNLGYRALVRGAVTTLSASRVSWYYLAQTDFTHTDSIGGMGYQYARFLLQSSEPCAKAIMDARLANPLGIWPNHLVINLYGDPSLSYQMPQSAAVMSNIAETKAASDGIWVQISSAILSRADSVECFAQDLNRCAGIRIYYESTVVQSIAPGSEVSIVGRISTEAGMRVLENASVNATGATSTISPLGISNANCADSKTFGLLTTVWGRVLSCSTSSFVLSDGSTDNGITVACHNFVTPPPVGSYARVVGICTPDDVSVYRTEDITY